MKNIILIGASRAGKSSFTKLLNERLNNILIIRTDLLRLAFREAICKDETMSISSLRKNKDYINYVVSYYKYANMYDVEYIKVIDTVDFEPKDYNLFENSIMICLGYADTTKEEVVSNLRKYDTDLDWTRSKSDEKLLAFAEGEIKNSNYLKEQCKKYNIKYVDTSKNRNKVLKELLEYVINKIND